MRAVDCHGHYVSPRIVTTLEAGETADRFGVAVVRAATGAPTLRVRSQAPTRPLQPALLDLSDRATKLNQVGIGVQAIGTWLDATAYTLPPEEGAAWSRLLNDSVAADVRDANGAVAFIPLATLPMQDGRRAAEELQRTVGTLGFRGAMIGTNVNGSALDDRSLDPLWAAAQQAQVPIVLHPYDVAGADRQRDYWLANLVGNPFDTTIAAASLIFGGVLDRFPDLDLVLVHGGGCLPYQMGRLGRGFEVRPETHVNHVQAPRDYLRRFYYDTVLFHAPAVRYLVDTVGADRVVLGSDYPFDLGDPQPSGVVQQSGLDAGTVDRILTHNGRRVLGLPVSTTAVQENS